VRESASPPDGPVGESVVETIDLRKRFDGHEVLRGVSFTAVRGETLVIMGGSGSGKTVTLRLVAGLIRPSSGRVASSIGGSRSSRRGAAADPAYAWATSSRVRRCSTR
jgi:ABC-type transporter Mla maintaining outer membrane lipid asymmetry ATPase subunit MlaF